MKRLVKNGEIYLDGTLPKYKKERMVYEQFETIDNIIERHNLEGGVEDIEQIVELYAEIYRACKKGAWVTIRNGDFVYCEPTPPKGAKEFKVKRIAKKEI